MGKIISLKYDFSFKYLFLNETVRRYFISDALGIPLEEIRSVRLANTFLWKQYQRQKQGILDIVVELNDDSRVNIELQMEFLSYWDKRSLFYLNCSQRAFSQDRSTGNSSGAFVSAFLVSIWTNVRNTIRSTDYGTKPGMSFRIWWRFM